MDDFEDSTTQNWTEGGASPNPPTNVAGGPPGSTRYLQDVSSGDFGGGGKMTVFNEFAQWSGDYLATGITEIRAMIRVDPSSDSSLSLRVGFQEATKFGQADGGYFSLVPLVVPNDGNWYEVVLPIELSDMANEGDHGLTYAQTLSNVGQFRIYHSATASWQGAPIAATIGLDNITAGPVETGTRYQGWLWETSAYSNGFSVEEENCFGRLDMTINEDTTWAYTGTDQVCRGRQTSADSRSLTNPSPFVTDSFEVDGSVPIGSAGGNLYELSGELAGSGEGVQRLATALIEPSAEDLVIVGAYQATDLPDEIEGLGFIHVLAKSTASIMGARTAADLEGSTWRMAMTTHVVSETAVNAEISNSGILTLNLQAGGVCSYTTSTVFPDFVKNRDLYSAVQTSSGTNLDNRAVQAGINGAELTDCTYSIDTDGYLAVSTTLTFDSAPGLPQQVDRRYVVSDGDQYLVPAPAAAGVDSNPQALLAGYRAASGLPASAIDGSYLFYVVLSEFEATGTSHSEGRVGRQEYDFRGRGLLTFDSSTPGTVPEGETGTWYSCTANLIMDGVEYGYSGDYGLGTASPDGEISAESLFMSTCDYRLDADGALLVHVTDHPPDEPFPLDLTLRGYVNANAEVLALAAALTDPDPTTVPDPEDAGSVYFILGMRYTGNPAGDEDTDALSNLDEFRFPLPLEEVPLLLRRSDNGRWFRYALNDSTIVAADSVALTSNLDWNVESVSDFDGDGKDDVLIRRQGNGRWYLYLMDGAVVVDSANMDIATSLDWALVAVADFNGDGTSDLLIRNQANGRWRMYLMDGLTILQTELVNLPGLVWDTVASGHFDLDGKGDLLVRRSDNGRWRMYRFDGPSVVETALVGLAENLVWEFQRAADFNGDGRLDVLVRRTDYGLWRLYFMDGTSVLDTDLVDLATNPNWQVESAADFDMDGRADALLRNTATGVWRLYLLDATTVKATDVLSIPTNSTIVLQAVADFDFDDNQDLLVRNVNNGRWFVYRLDGTAVESSDNVNMTTNLVWDLVAPILH